MSDNNLLKNIVIAHALNLRLNIDENIIKQATLQIPTGLFGVFVTVRKSQYQTISKWPRDIHGCIGWWQKNFENVSQEKIYSNLLRVANDAVWEDDRRKYFGPIERDADAMIEIDFMNNYWPVDEITGIIQNKSKSTQFNNDEYGLIVTGSHSATYLPGVFDSKTSWQDLTSRLLSKAGISDRKQTSNVTYYAYDIIQYKKRLFDLIDFTFASRLFLPSIFNFINVAYLTKSGVDQVPQVPHTISENGKISYDSTDSVRNVATIYDLAISNRLFSASANNAGAGTGAGTDSALTHSTLEKMNTNIIQATKVYEGDPFKKEQCQTSAFLLLAISELKISSLNNIQDKIVTRLVEAVTKEQLSPEFERGEVLLALQKIEGPGVITPLLDKQAEKPIVITDTRNSIFQLNWEAQFIAAHNGPISKINELTRLLLSEVDHFIEIYQKESNYLAVAFEGLSSLYPFVSRFDQAIQNEMRNSILVLFVALVKRRNSYGFINFLNKTARLDITGHFLQGLIALTSTHSQLQSKRIESNHEGKREREIKKQNQKPLQNRDEAIQNLVNKYRLYRGDSVPTDSVYYKELLLSTRLKFDPRLHPAIASFLRRTDESIV